jgi:hypothetical protein
MPDEAQFAYALSEETSGESALRPLMPITLSVDDHSVSANGLLDSRGAVNVLPYSIGLALGARWEDQRTHVHLTGNLGRVEARGLIVNAVVHDFAVVRLAFAWTQTDNVPLLLGQVNFFMEFNVCFLRRQSIFEVSPAQQ